MKAKLAKVLTDNVSDLSQELAERFNIGLVPFPVLIGEEHFLDNEKDPDYVYEKLREGYFVKTSQPSIGEFDVFYQSEIDKGFEPLLVLTLTAKESGVYNSAFQAAKSFGDEVVVLDTKQGTGAQALLAIRAAQYLEKYSFEETVERMKAHIEDEDTRLWGYLKTIKYIRKRLSLPKKLLSYVLNPKPFLTVEDGKIKSGPTPRTTKAAMKTIFELMKNDGLKQGGDFNGVVLHTSMPEEADELEERIRNLYNIQFLERIRVGAGLGGHLGPDVFGAAYWKRNIEAP